MTNWQYRVPATALYPNEPLHCSNVAVFLDQDAAEDRKAHIRQADLSRQKNQALSELETEAKERAQYLLERANAMRMEQEDEVKKLNEVQQENQPFTLSSLLFVICFISTSVPTSLQYHTFPQFFYPCPIQTLPSSCPCVCRVWYPFVVAS